MGIFLNFIICTVVATLSLLLVSCTINKLREKSDSYQPEFKVGDKVVGLNEHVWYVKSFYKDEDGVYRYGIGQKPDDSWIDWVVTEDQLELFVD